MLSHEQQQEQESRLRELRRNAENAKMITQRTQKQEVLAEINALKQEIEKLKKFDGETYIIILMVSIFADIIGLAGLGLIGIFANFPMWLFLAIKLHGQHAMVKRFTVAIILEFIPGLSVAPIYTIATFWIKMNVDKKIKSCIAYRFFAFA